MKMKPVTVDDVDIAMTKIGVHKRSIRNYIFVTTDKIDPEVRGYAG
jgi:spore coat protein CotF